MIAPKITNLDGNVQNSLKTTDRNLRFTDTTRVECKFPSFTTAPRAEELLI